MTVIGYPSNVYTVSFWILLITANFGIKTSILLVTVQATTRHIVLNFFSSIRTSGYGTLLLP